LVGGLEGARSKSTIRKYSTIPSKRLRLQLDKKLFGLATSGKKNTSVEQIPTSTVSAQTVQQMRGDGKKGRTPLELNPLLSHWRKRFPHRRNRTSRNSFKREGGECVAYCWDQHGKKDTGRGLNISWAPENAINRLMGKKSCG